jgi:hypothetical protein
MKKGNKEWPIILNGGFQVEWKMYNEYSGEVVFRGKLAFNGQEFNDMPVLRLVMCKWPSDKGVQEVLVWEEFCKTLPYLKPVREFREILSTKLEHILVENLMPPFMREGMQKYLAGIMTYSEDKGLIRQARDSLNNFKPGGKESGEQAKAILKVMGVIPCTGIKFGQIYLDPEKKRWSTQSVLPEVQGVVRMLNKPPLSEE